MKGRKLLTSALGAVAAVALGAFLWWRHAVDDRLGYCQTPTETCINRQGMAVGEPCECHGRGRFRARFDRNGHTPVGAASIFGGVRGRPRPLFGPAAAGYLQSSDRV